MSFLDGLRHRFDVLLRGERYAEELAREQSFHIDLETLAHSGDAPALEAELRARRAFGNLTYYREATRDATVLRWLDHLRQDWTYALRGLRRSPGFTATVVVTLALGFGANAGMYSLLERLFVRSPEGVRAPEEVHRLYQSMKRPTEAGGRLSFGFFPYPYFAAISAAIAPAALAAFTDPESVTVVTGTARSAAFESQVTGDYFGVLGLRPALGRFFTGEENGIDVPTPVAVVSDALWKTSFGAKASVLGRTITIGQLRFTIIGVAPPGFSGLDLGRVDLWVPANTIDAAPSYGAPGPWYTGFSYSFHAVARIPTAAEQLRVTTAGTTAARSVHIPYLQYDSTERIELGPIAAAAGPAKLSPDVAMVARLSWVAVLVLFIACANVVNLLLLRGTRRKQEIAVRRALGSSSGRLYAQLTIESILLSLIGASFAIVVALWTGSALRTLMLPRVHWATGMADWHTLLLLAALGLGMGVLCGIAPSLRAMRPDLVHSLKAGSRDSAYRRSRMAAALLVAQMSLSTVLLVGSGLFLRSLANLRSVDLGYDVDRVLIVRPVFASSGSHTDDLARAIPLARDRLEHVDGVEAAAFTNNVPLQGETFISMYLPGRDSLPRIPRGGGPLMTTASPDYFRALGIRFRAGRGFSQYDATNQLGAVVVSERTARLFWPGQNPLGQCIIVGNRLTSPCKPVVGVTSDAHAMSILEPPVVQVYAPAASGTALILRTSASKTARVAREANVILKQLMPSIDGTTALPLGYFLQRELRPWQLGATLFTAFGFLALMVSCIGVYSVVAYGVSQRTNEMGIRAALGARRVDIVDLVLSEGLAVLGAGLLLGLLGSLALGRMIAAQLFGVTSSDPSVMIGAATVLGAVCLAASVIPGWRAARTDPAVALRAE